MQYRKINEHSKESFDKGLRGFQRKVVSLLRDAGASDSFLRNQYLKEKIQPWDLNS